MLTWIRKQISKWPRRSLRRNCDQNEYNHGPWRVRYPEGFCSEWLLYDKAKNLSEVYGGELEYIGEIYEIN